MRPFLLLLYILSGISLTAQNVPATRTNILFVITDDHSWIHTSAAGSRAVKTPNMDQLAKEGIFFNHGFIPTPSCTPARAAILTGQEIWRLEQGASLHGPLTTRFAVYPDILEKAGYHVGYTGKGWAPGEVAVTGRVRNPSGPVYNRHSVGGGSSALSGVDYAANFNEFLNSRQNGQPFCFWVGFFEPHRPYKTGLGKESGLNARLMDFPTFLPDVPEVRNDMLDYLYEIQYADNQLGKIINHLKAVGELDNTLIVITADNGMPFPRGKGTLYDYGVRVPLILRWGDKCPGGQVVDDFVSLTDVAPTFLEAAGLPIPGDMTGRSLMNIITSGQSGRIESSRDKVFFGRERHAVCRPEEDENDPGYPSRAVRTAQYLYIRNYAPHRWPHGDGARPTFQGLVFADTDDGPSARYIIQNANKPEVKPFFDLCFGKRPGEELYDVVQDPDQVRNLAQLPEYLEVKKNLRSMLEVYQAQTGDPRIEGKTPWDYYPFYVNNPAGLVPYSKNLAYQRGGTYITHGGFLGQPGSTSIRIWARTSEPGSFSVRYGLNPDNLSLGLSQTVTTVENDNSGWVTLEGLQPGTSYFYQLETGAYVGAKGSFFTLPLTSAKTEFSFEFGQGFYPIPLAGNDPEIPAAVIRNAEDTSFFSIKMIPEPEILADRERFKTWLKENPDNARYHRNMPTFWGGGAPTASTPGGNSSRLVNNCLLLFPDPREFRTLSDSKGNVLAGMPGKTQQEWLVKEIRQAKVNQVFITAPVGVVDPARESALTQLSSGNPEWKPLLKERKNLLKSFQKTQKQVFFLTETPRNNAVVKLSPKIWEVFTHSEVMISSQTEPLPETGLKKSNGLKYEVVWADRGKSYCTFQVKNKPSLLTLSFRNIANGKLIHSLPISSN
ncbi:MAG: sulfatase-like hydrolase/transferase [Bacteroidia bacterium]|nr:sulfatase-like hydrolase/transferase [Bacteroidia bacterium]